VAVWLADVVVSVCNPTFWAGLPIVA